MSTHKKLTVVIDGKQMKAIRTPRVDVFIVHPGGGANSAPKDQSAKNLLPQLGKAMSKAGIKREAVFRSGSSRNVYAYSMNPANPEQLVREDAQGKRTVGRMVDGRFKPVRATQA